MFPQSLDSQGTYDGVIPSSEFGPVLYTGDDIWQQVSVLTGLLPKTNSHHKVQRVTVKFLILPYRTRNLCVFAIERPGEYHRF